MLGCNTACDCNKLKEKFDVNIQESAKGVRVDINPKDGKDVTTIQNLAKSWKNFGEDFCK